MISNCNLDKKISVKIAVQRNHIKMFMATIKP